MKKSNQEKSSGLSEIGLGLDDLIHRGARQIIRQVIETELEQMLEEYANVKTLSGQRTVVRNGYLSQREVLTAVGPVVRERAEGAGSLGIGGEVQLGGGAAVRATLAADFSGAAVVVPQGNFHRRQSFRAQSAGRR